MLSVSLNKFEIFTIHIEIKIRSKRIFKNCNSMVQLTMAHDLLCDTIDLHNAAFTVQSLLNLLNSLAALLFSTYNIGNMYMTNTLNSREMMTSLVYFFFSMFFFYFIICSIVFSALVKSEGNKCASLLQKSVKFDGGSVALTNIYNLQHQHRPAQISTGLFDCDLTLLYMVSHEYITFL